jgi:hypothetical protein
MLKEMIGQREHKDSLTNKYQATYLITFGFLQTMQPLPYAKCNKCAAFSCYNPVSNMYSTAQYS